MKLVFMATPEFAVPSLKKIIEAHEAGIHSLELVITQPDKKVGRKQILTPPPVKLLAEEHKISVFQPERLNKDQELIDKLKAIKPDLMITVAYGQIIKEEILNIAPIVNLHASLLPKYRGPAPINWCLINGDEEVGLCTMLTEKGVDTGPVLLKSSIVIDESIDSQSLTQMLADLGGDLLIQTINDFEKIKPEPQEDLDDVALQYSPFMNKDLGKVDFAQDELVLRSANPKQDYFVNRKSNSAKNIHNLVRALKPWPGAYFIYKDQKIALIETSYEDASSELSAGQIQAINKEEKSFAVQTQQGLLVIKKLKAQGKNEMPALDWFHGQRLSLNDSI